MKIVFNCDRYVEIKEKAKEVQIRYQDFICFGQSKDSEDRDAIFCILKSKVEYSLFCCIGENYSRFF